MTKYKNAGSIGNIVKTRSPFLARYGHPRTPKRSENGHFSQRLVLTVSLGFADVCGRKSCPERTKTPFLGPRSYSKSPNHALEKVPTSETPCTHTSALHNMFQPMIRMIRLVFLCCLLGSHQDLPHSHSSLTLLKVSNNTHLRGILCTTRSSSLQFNHAVHYHSGGFRAP